METSGSNLNASNKAGLIARLEGDHAAVSSSQRRLLETIAECERAGLWLEDGARDPAEWVSAQLGISHWAARRWIAAAQALPDLPMLRAALDSGALSLDKVLELSRFATPETEAKLIAWAQRVMPATVRHKADVACAPPREEVVEIERARYLRYWFQDDGASLCLEGLLPADQGAVVASALDRMAGRLPDIVADSGDEPEPPFETSLEMRRADALCALASHRIASDADSDRATVVIHAPLEALAGGDGSGCETESGAVLHPDTARRLACDCRLELVLEGKDGKAVGIGRASRTPPPWLLRQLRQRDRGCTFPGCGARWFLHAHHIRHWIRGGPTDLDNLVLACGCHHRLVHEHGWDVRLEPNGAATWLRPDGSAYAPGPPVPDELSERASPEVLELACC